jgi:hypothetical protein
MQPLADRRAPASSARSSRPACRGPERNVSRSRQSGHSRSRSAGLHAPVLAVCCSCRRKPGGAGQRAQLAAEDHVVGGARRVQHAPRRAAVGRVDAAQHAHDRRDAAAGADEQELGRAVGRAARRRPRRRRARRSSPGRAVRTRYGETLPSSTLDRDADPGRRAVRVGGQRVRAPVVDAVDRSCRCADTGRACGRATPSRA